MNQVMGVLTALSLAMLAGGEAFANPSAQTAAPEPREKTRTVRQNDHRGAISGLSLRWDAPSACPDGQAVERDVARRIRDGGAAKRPLAARARVRETNDGTWVLELETEQDGTFGARTLRGKTCEGLAETTATILALAMAPGLATPTALTSPVPSGVAPHPEGKPPETAPEGATTHNTASPSHASAADPTNADPTNASPTSVSPTNAGPRTSGFALAEGGVLVGTMGAARPSAGAGFGLEIGRASIALVGTYGAEQTVTVPGQAVGITLSLAAGRLDGCYSLVAADRLSFASCLGVGVAHTWGTGAAIANPRPGSLTWLFGEVGAMAAVRVSGAVRLRLEGAVVAPSRRPSAYIDGVGEVGKPAIVQARVGGGLALDLW